MKIGNPFKRLIDDVKENIDLRIDLAKVQGIKKASHVSTQLTFYIFIILLLCISLFFFGLALAFYFSQLLESNTLGFLLAGGIPFVFLLMMLLFRKSITAKLRDFYVSIISENREDEK